MLWENMREDDSNWFSRWEEDLPSPEELMPLSQTLITPDLALAFDIQNHSNNSNNSPRAPSIPFPQSSPNTAAAIARSSQIAATQHPNSSEFDTNSAELGSPATTGDEPARTLKRPRLVWTPQLHKRFVDAVAHLGIKNAVPKTIMQLMSVDGLTRENVASHLQKYRLYLKRMQGLSSGGGMGAATADPATDHLFASSPVPPHFLHQGRSNSEHFLPFLPVPALHHQQPVAASAVAHPQIHQQYHHYKPAGPFGSPPNGHFDHAFMSMSSQPVHRMGAPLHNSVPPSYIEDMESGTANGGRRILTLFPTGDD